MICSVDLHIHSSASDGSLTPTEVVHLALRQGMEVIALTDHDTTDGIGEAQQAAAGSPLKVIPGLEINTEGPDGDIHVLGYYINPNHEPLQERLRILREARLVRARKMIERLAELGMPLEWERVLEIAGEDPAIGRPHIARALAEAGYVATAREAFDRYIGNDGPAYVPRLRMRPEEAIAVIHQAGGVAVLAHPDHHPILKRLPDLVEAGLDGLEVYYPEHTPQDVARLGTLAARYGLLMTGGSDFHGPGLGKDAPMGSVTLPAGLVSRLTARWQRQRA